MRRTKGFTLIELLVVVAIIALLISILLPSLSRAREMSKRAVCSANLRGLGQAMYIYSNDNYEQFPTAGSDPALAGRNAKPGYYRTRDPADPNNSNRYPSTTADLWLLVKGAFSTPKQFICPSSSRIPDDFGGRDPAELYDFRGQGSGEIPVTAPNLSYGYHFGHDGTFASEDRTGGVANGTKMDPRFPVMADENPYFYPEEKPTSGSSEYPTNCGAGESPNGNSMNHQEDGQNILFADSHVSFEKDPRQGIEGDNLYTRGESGDDSSSPDTCGEPGLPIKGPGRDGAVNLVSMTDCLILP